MEIKNMENKDIGESADNKINIGLFGFGTVGGSFYRILDMRKKEIETMLSADVTIKKIFTRGNRNPLIDNVGHLMVNNPDDILNDKSINVIVELMGGIEPAREYIEKAVKNGKSVITANKALLAEHGEGIFKLCKKHNAHIGFEAAVGGGIPILRSIKNGLAGDSITSVFSIINGTSNYILSKMTNEGGKFDDILKKAQEKGYAEADPSFDINGIDSAHKLVILGRLAFAASISLKDVIIEGIKGVSDIDICFAHDLGYKIKLLGILKNDDSKIEIRVHPTLIPSGSLLSNVDGVFNAFFLNAKFAGPISLTGYGAGGMATASAVMGDFIEIAGKIINSEKHHDIFLNESSNKVQIKRKKDIISRYYLRFSAMDRPGVLAKISKILGDNSISISSMIQQGRKIDGSVPIVITTHEANEEELFKSIELCDKLDIILAKTMILRIEDNVN
jgi:homoserine dehydrogenase